MILKICGITNQDDATAAVEAGANALGFNFYSGSLRYVAPEIAAEIVSPAEVLRVGVFVNEPPDRIVDIARRVSLQVAQLHGRESKEDYPLGIPVWKAERVANVFDFQRFDWSAVEALLLDGPASGLTFPWGLARAAKRRVIIAGGLDASNVARAIEEAHPWGVDACSRIESAPGRKDHKRMKEFIEAARKALVVL